MSDSTLNNIDLTMVVAPASDHEGGLDFGALFDFVNKKVGLNIQIDYCSSYGEAIEALEKGDAQIGWLGPYAYIEAAKMGVLEPFAIGVRKGENSPNYRSLFITKNNSPIHKLEDVKGRRLAISDPHSTSGHAVPKQELAEVGIHLKNEHEFEVLITAHDHDQAISLVMSDQADVAAISSINLDENISKGVLNHADIRIIHTSQDIPGAPLVLRTSLAQEIRVQIKAAVLEAHQFIQIGGYGGILEKYVDPVESHTRFLEAYLKPQWGWRAYSGIIALLAITWFFVIDLEIEPLSIFSNMSAYLGDVVGRMMPPDFSNFDQLMLSMFETVEIAFLGTLLAIILSIPVGLLSAKNVAPNRLVFFVARTITVFFRAIPEFIMAMILVIAVGFGAIPGVLALGFHTMGFLAKFYAEAIEHVDVGPIEALQSTGAIKLHVLTFAIIPQIIPSFIGNNLYILDRNVRMATMLGIVGAGGIGYELQSSFRMFDYPRVSAIIFVIFATIFLIDLLSSYIRSKVH